MSKGKSDVEGYTWDNLTDREQAYLDWMEDAIAMRNVMALDAGMSYDTLLRYATNAEMSHWAMDILREPGLTDSAIQLEYDGSVPKTLWNQTMNAANIFLCRNTHGHSIRFFDRRVLHWLLQADHMSSEKEAEVTQNQGLVDSIVNQLQIGRTNESLSPEQFRIATNMVSKLYNGFNGVFQRVLQRRNLPEGTRVLRNVQLPVTMECVNSDEDQNVQGRHINLIAEIDYVVLEGSEPTASMLFLCPVVRNAEMMVNSPDFAYFREKARLGDAALRALLPRSMAINAYAIVVSEQPYEHPCIVPLMEDGESSIMPYAGAINGFTLETLIAENLGMTEDFESGGFQEPMLSNAITRVVDTLHRRSGHLIPTLAGLERETGRPYVMTVTKEKFTVQEPKREENTFKLRLEDIEGLELPNDALDYLFVETSLDAENLRTVRAHAVHSEDVSSERITLLPGQMVLPYAKEGYEIVFPESINYLETIGDKDVTVYVARRDDGMKYGYGTTLYISLNGFSEEELKEFLVSAVYYNGHEVEAKPFQEDGGWKQPNYYVAAKMRKFEPFRIRLVKRSDPDTVLYEKPCDGLWRETIKAISNTDLDQ